jgi:shikimate kinase
MKRLLEGPPMVLATGGGAILNAETRGLLKQHAITVWLRADLKIIASRVQRRDTRPLLRGKDPLEALSAMAEVRYPVYGQADVTVDVGDRRPCRGRGGHREGAGRHADRDPRGAGRQ